jgi:hypothetical protein
LAARDQETSQKSDEEVACLTEPYNPSESTLSIAAGTMFSIPLIRWL